MDIATPHQSENPAGGSGRSWTSRVSRSWLYFGIFVACAAAVVVMMLVWSGKSSDQPRPALEVKPYSELEKPAPMTPDQQRVFDQVAESTVDSGATGVALIPGPDKERCPDAQFEGASEYQSPSAPGPYLGEGRTMVLVELPAADRVKVSFYSCPDGD